jgi:hypothetical protein
MSNQPVVGTPLSLLAPPQRGNRKIVKARETALRFEAAKQGRQSTILTGGGIATDQPFLGHATLLGG